MTPRTEATLKLTDEDTRDAAVERLTTYLPLEAAGYECTTEMVLDVLIKAAVTQQTIECVCNDVDETVDGETIRGYLNEQIRVDDLQELERRVNQALVAGLPRRLWKVKLQSAIDRVSNRTRVVLTDLPCWLFGGMLSGAMRHQSSRGHVWQQSKYTRRSVIQRRKPKHGVSTSGGASAVNARHG